MKKAILPLAALSLLIASCNPDTKDSYQTLSFPEYNLIIDDQNPDQLAQASYVNYQIKNNISKEVVDVKATDLVINNQKYSFETDTMKLRTKSIPLEGGTSYNLYFSKKGPAGVGCAASDINGTFVYYYTPPSNVLNPVYESIQLGQRLDLSYILNDRYKVQTFWPVAFYLGQTTSFSDGESHSTKASHYLTQIDFEKNIASVYVYNAELSANQDSKFPKVIRFENIPVKFNHHEFYLEAESPKTTVLGKKDNQVAMVDSVGFEAKNFTMNLISADLTEVQINYTLDGHNVNFHGNSIVKPGN